MTDTDTTELNSRFQQGLDLHHQGRLAEAASIYREILRREPGYFDALHLLGVISSQTGHAGRAAELIGLAIALRPDHAEAHHNRGNVLRGLNRPEEAISSFSRAIDLNPGLAPAWFGRAAVLAELGRPAHALSDLDTVIALRPDQAEAHYDRGNALRALGRSADALASYDAAIALSPDHAEAHNNRANASRDLGHFEAALSSYDRAIKARPDYAEAHYNRGATLRDLKRSEEALAAYDRAIASRPDFPEAHHNRGNALRDLDRFDEALSAYDRALTSRPNYAEAHYSRGGALSDLGRRDEAFLSYDRAVALKPDSAEARLNLGFCQLATGDFDRGWENFEWRWKSRQAGTRPGLTGPSWRVDDSVRDKTVLVHAEQGFGDSLQFCRYVPMLAQRTRVVLDVPRPLHRLFAGLPGIVGIITREDPLPPFDTWIGMMSLPLMFRTTPMNIPAAIPYLNADPERSAAWKQRLAALPGRKIGLVWAGSPRYGEPRAPALDRRRSITLRHYAPLAAIPGLCLISLQKGESAAQASTPPEGFVLHDWTNELDDFAETAALVEGLDLVIAVDTSVAHLAGALGKPVWILNRYDQCWRWLRDRTDSPWYPTARLFRQRAPGDWTGVMRDVGEALRAWV